MNLLRSPKLLRCPKYQTDNRGVFQQYMAGYSNTPRRQPQREGYHHHQVSIGRFVSQIQISCKRFGSRIMKQKTL